MYAEVGHGARSRFGLDVRMLRFWNRPGSEEPVMLAQDLLAGGRQAEAVRVVELALDREPDDPELLLTAGLAQLRRGEVVSAQRWLTRAASAAPDWIEPWRWLGEVLVQREEIARARWVFERVLALGGRDPELLEKAKRVARLGGIQERLDRFVRDPGCEEPSMLAHDLVTIGRLDDALDVTCAALADDDEDADVLLAHARALRARGELDEAEEILERTVRLAGDWAEPLRHLAEVWLQRDAPHEARLLIERGLALEPEHRALGALWLRVEAMLEELEPELDLDAFAVDARDADAPPEDLALDALLASWADEEPLPGEDTVPGMPAPLSLERAPAPVPLTRRARSPRSYRPTPYRPPSPTQLFPGVSVCAETAP